MDPRPSTLELAIRPREMVFKTWRFYSRVLKHRQVAGSVLQTLCIQWALMGWNVTKPYVASALGQISDSIECLLFFFAFTASHVAVGEISLARM
jgi:hypothetical protein